MHTCRTPKNVSKNQILSFQNKVFDFYESNGRTLPWRLTTDPYLILLSEVMLQQTQVSRVIKYFEEWKGRWPTVEKLASASKQEVLKAWLGLGYNNRGLRLHQAAKIICKDFAGNVLEAMKHYESIPGVGRYTANAVLIFSSNLDLVTVDTNIRRILIHEFSLCEDTPDKEIWQLAARCLPKQKSRVWHNALMDFGALELTAKNTGIRPKTQQSSFEGSDRQIRAKVLRLLLECSLSFDDIHEGLDIYDVSHSRLQDIVSGLLKDGLVVFEEKNQRFCVEEKPLS